MIDIRLGRKLYPSRQYSMTVRPGESAAPLPMRQRQQRSVAGLVTVEKEIEVNCAIETTAMKHS